MKYFHPFSTQRRCELGNSLCTSKAAWRVRQCAEVRALDPQSHQQLHQQVRQPWWIESTQQERTEKSQTSLMCFSLKKTEKKTMDRDKSAEDRHALVR